MHDSAELRELLKRSIVREGIRHVVESGTHEGLGSTRFLAEVFAEVSPPRSFVTIEANWRSWRRARRNLRRFPFVQVLWGESLDTREAIEFVESDDCLRHHARYPNVFIDETDDPVGFYVRELRGGLGGVPRDLRHRLLMKFHRLVFYRGERLLARCLDAVRDENPLIVLDSAGGVGWLEFSTVLASMEGRPYVVLLDDVHHVKHFRSLAHVRRDPSFEMLGVDEAHGWLLARHEAN
jgi:hypothetical protein